MASVTATPASVKTVPYAANGGGAAVSVTGGSTGGASAAAIGVSLQSAPLNLQMPLPKQLGARPLTPAQTAHMSVRPVTAPTGLVKLAAQLTASGVGLAASTEASGVLKVAVKQTKTQSALSKLQAAAVRNACERVHADCLAVDAKCRAVTADLQSLALIQTDLTREHQRLSDAKATREFEIAQIKTEIAKENDATAQLTALATKMRAELARLTKERDHYQREAQIAERNADRLRSAVHEKAASTKRLFAAFDVGERDLGVAGGGASSTALVPASNPVDRSVPAFLR